MSETLDIGCGGSKTPGAVGIDILPAPGVDIVHDLNKLPWPLEPNRFDAIVCSHVLGELQYKCFPLLWEKHFCFVWRARNLEVELEVVKEEPQMNADKRK